MHNKKLHMVAFLLLVIGGLNWLLVGVGGWDVVAMLLGGMDSMLARAVYVLVGLAAIYEIATHKSTCKMCSSGGSAGNMSASGDAPRNPGMS